MSYLSPSKRVFFLPPIQNMSNIMETDTLSAQNMTPKSRSSAIRGQANLLTRSSLEYTQAPLLLQYIIPNFNDDAILLESFTA